MMRPNMWKLQQNQHLKEQWNQSQHQKKQEKKSNRHLKKIHQKEKKLKKLIQHNLLQLQKGLQVLEEQENIEQQLEE